MANKQNRVKLMRHIERRQKRFIKKVIGTFATCLGLVALATVMVYGFINAHKTEVMLKKAHQAEMNRHRPEVPPEL